MDKTSSPDLKAYAGRWVAIVRGRVVASGCTAHEALLNCRAERVKDEPVLRYIPPLRAGPRTKSNELA
ncbi:MAG: hypothetical protein IT331_10390 [Anaerolineae bacterium]|nr:hypothetical protein [Anaerolineae bacterium]